MIIFDLSHVPFSRFGSYSAFVRREHLMWTSVHGINLFSITEVFRIEVTENGKPVPFEEEATPTRLTLRADGGEAVICMPAPGTVRMEGRGIGLRLTQQGGQMLPRGEDAWEIRARWPQQQKYLFQRLAGTVQRSSDRRVDPKSKHHRCQQVTICAEPGDDGRWELVADEYDCEPDRQPHTDTFSDALVSIETEWNDWLKNTLLAPEEFADTRELAAYILWSATVPPGGWHKRPVVLMSKNHMNAVWSWDHCFNAIALAKQHPELAWDQFMVFFDTQHEQGAFADMVTDDRVYRECVKPPIHGWAMRKLLERSTPPRETLEACYAHLTHWTEWWFRYRDTNGDGLPEYFHGNDSGWDNCTAFDVDVPLTGPELQAYLVLQMEVLGEVAERLGRPEEAVSWRARSQSHLKKILDVLWRDDGFVALRAIDNSFAKESRSLFQCMPMALGHRLPESVRQTLIKRLGPSGDLLTEWGWATESPKSKHYISDGYWRGPIWAPVVMLAYDGLRDAGEDELALDVAERFCRLCEKSGMSENFDAIAGEGLRDRAYTWTASVFLLLANDLVNASAPPPPKVKAG